MGDRIADLDAGKEPEEASVKISCVDRPPGVGQREVKPYCPKEGVFTRHIGAGDKDDFAQVANSKIVTHFLLIREEGVADSLGLKDWLGRGLGFHQVR